MTSAALAVRPVADDERDQLAELLRRDWGTTEMISRGTAHDLMRCPALFCVDGDRVVGLATYAISGGGCD